MQNYALLPLSVYRAYDFQGNQSVREPDVSASLLCKPNINVAMHMIEVRVNAKKCTVLLG